MHAFRALTLNVWGLPTARDRAARIRAVAGYLARADLDVVAIQEAWLPADRRTLIAGAAQGGLIHARTYNPALAGSGLMILSRWPVVESGFTPYLLNGDPFTPDFYAPKGIAHARLDAPFGPLDVYTTHALAQHSNIGGVDRYQPHRIAQMVQFARLVVNRSAGAPALALADFNVLPGSPGYRVFLTLGGFGEAFASVRPAVPAITYDSRNPYAPQTLTRRLDYIFYRGGPSLALRPTAAEITHRDTPRGSGLPAYSDHYGVLATFEVEPAPPRVAGSARDDVLRREMAREAADILRGGLADARARQRRWGALAALGISAAGILARTRRRRWLALPGAGAMAGAALTALTIAELRALHSLLGELEVLIHE
ncbi:MAG TPA: endonuclease/exonuclease/phosphatase family protein [Aggregatilineales bacterium]|nr:endonuclease/exonuclease/phosphatase family protein [Aggregatilineales bacterium]HPV08156.1 endonuclease/exonuclease/phosphatase family protein [Aggregatilineales bacterium]HQA68282.1 endonuclease/exonuclease/phosphatase family protein [Aggregatilineales bacterium]HQE17393.1 endonuclease/exonuclease/phosphatase family protein [Aggregatilineales bacterium]